jgi:sugar phosphate isomerase/epimerase
VVSIHPRVSVNGIALAGRPLREQLQVAAAAGIPAYGVLARDIDPAAVHPQDDVAIAYLVLPAMFTLDAPDGWDAERDRVRATLDAAAAVGAPCVYTTTGPAGRLSFEEAATALAAAAEPVVEHARRRGVRLLVEITNQLRDDLGFLYTLRDAVDVAQDAGLDVCADLLWCWRERGLRETIDRAIDRIALVQVSDVQRGATSMPCRLVPGDGAAELERPLRALLDAGYAGRFDVELLGPRIDAEGPERALARGAQRLTQMLERLGA